MIDPQKERKKETLNKKQKLFHFLQRAVASKGYCRGSYLVIYRFKY